MELKRVYLQWNAVSPLLKYLTVWAFLRIYSGKTNRHRLNRGGDRAANSALHIIAIGRLRTDARTQEYAARRVAEGHSKMEALRCLKRYVSREVYTLLRKIDRSTVPN